MEYFCFATHLETDQENNGSVNFPQSNGVPILQEIF